MEKIIKKNEFLWFKVIISALLLFIEIKDAQASLGQLEASIEDDRQKISAVRHASRIGNSYTVHEIANQRINIREYVSHGVVFAVSWTGARHPDLTGLLGKYFQDYQNSSRHSVKVRGVRSHGSIHGQNVIVEKSGHMRWIQGKAYVPNLMPMGVTSSEIQ